MLLKKTMCHVGILALLALFICTSNECTVAKPSSGDTPGHLFCHYCHFILRSESMFKQLDLSMYVGLVDGCHL